MDLHTKEFCVDVSTYDPVTWVEKDAEACETTFVKECSDKTENVCANVTETACQVPKTHFFYFCNNKMQNKGSSLIQIKMESDT